MQVTRTVAQVRQAVAAARGQGRGIALVPTMGALHDGHLSLIRQAGADGSFVVVSVFVNPTQFNDPADLDRYPRDVDTDVALAGSAGADVVFTPDVREVYPDGFSTSIRVTGVSERWEGATRGASHFDGVALVVSKLFIMVGPDSAWFGRKDAQQIAVVTRAAADLNLPVTVRSGDTVRDRDGLALSSRNAQLTAADREAALSLIRSLTAARAAVAAGTSDVADLVSVARTTLVSAGAVPEYWAVVDPETFEPLEKVDPSAPALAIVAAKVGEVRLIDNLDLVV